jgi:hypothetical protein
MQQLGIFPSFAYSADPAENPLLNPFVTYPPGMYQTSAQPPGAYYGSRADGLGRPIGGFWSTFADTISAGWDGVTSAFSRKAPPRTMQPAAARAGMHGTSSLGTTISGIGTLLVVGLASYGGYKLYKTMKS